MSPSNRQRAFSVALLTLAALTPFSSAAETPARVDNATQVRMAFDAWHEGRGKVFDLLAENAVWTVAGNSPVSGVYYSKQDFLERAVRPINARLATPITPEVWHIVAQGDAVVVLWDGTATTIDGEPYRNSYAWHMVLDSDRIVRVTAFLDTWALNRLLE